MKEFEKEFLEYMKKAGTAQGMQDNLLLELFGILYVEPKELSLEDLAKKTGYSLASVSNKIKQMEAMGFEAMGLMKRIRKPKTRKIFIYMEKDFMDLWRKMLIAKHEGVIKNAKTLLPKIIEKSKEDKKDKEKSKIIENYYDQILKFEKVLKNIMKCFDKIK